MIKKYACIPHGLSRREFGAVAGGALLGTLSQKIARAADPAWTAVIVPDPQFLAETSSCSGATLYNNLIAWAVTNRNLSVNGSPLNIKGLIQVGDCQNFASASASNAAFVLAANAYAQAVAANMFLVVCPGNHDYENGGTAIDRSQIGWGWKAGGTWSPANLAAMYGGGMDLGNGDYALWGGAYPDPTFPVSTANNYVRLKIGSRKILICSGEFFPRSSVMSWFKDLHDTYTDHEVWFTTHGYITAANNLVTRGTGNNATNQYGPDFYSMAAAPASLCGTEMWSGASGFGGLTGMARNSLVTCGHWIDGYAGGSNWVWQKTDAANTAGRTVHQIFCDCQQGDFNPSPNCNVGSADVAHLLLLRIWPTTAEAFLVSTNTGKWTGGSGVLNSSSPVQLFSVPFSPVAPGIFPLPGSCCKTDG